ncbi:choline dehydrogenase [Massilia sp. R2A-15]|uniref:GMC family oxidoreductase n=1 Tax=Massilia sp. R2A-15 TaxID=3064278 RepID=UPI00273326D0|nr:choline dehydrogenase [Massilia sp. R2A-15]WLI90726.1 choline dehydrogenase [Massilia sp. R2A-15]
MFDYIIVGGGSAGCVLANRLSADPAVRVCLLEAGPADSSPFIRVPLGIVGLMMSKKLNWQYFTEPQQQLGGRRLFWPRGKTLGGSSSTNAMIYTRGNRADYDHWAALGNPGWGFDDVLPLFLRSEHHEDGASPLHGSGGPLNVAPLRSPNVLSRAFIDAAMQAGFPFNADFNGPEQEGVNCYEVTQKNGERWSAARAYLHPALARPNLTVLTGALAERVLFDGKRATGVAYRRGGTVASIAASREVLLAGGAINSPQLLMLSGIGEPQELARHGIALRHALPGVGRNLQDHLDVLVVQRCRLPVSLGLSLRTLPAQVKRLYDYIVHRSGALTSNSAEAGGFVKSRAQQELPDIQFHFTPARLDGHARTLRSAAFTLWGHGYALHACPLRPASRGRITLRSADPAAAPLIDPNYLSERADLEAMIDCVRAARRVLAAAPFDPFRGAEIFPGSEVQSDAEIEAFIRRKAETIYHPVGTCKMGADPMAVVDHRLKVHGVEGLRVIDASIMPTLIAGNTNAPTMMIAEKGADMILSTLGAAHQDAAVAAPQH